MLRGKGARIWAVLLGLLLSQQAAALSLGNLVVRSVPGKPLRAHIPYTLLPEEKLTEVTVTLASAEQYKARGIPYAELLRQVGVALESREEGKGRLQLFSESPWQGGEIELLLFISWSNGVMERRYRMEPATPPQAEAPRFVEVAPNETLDEIAIRLSKGSNRSYLHMMYALFLANPDAFYSGNMNNLKKGQQLRIPSGEELYALSDKEVFDGIRSQYETWQQLRDSEGQRGTEAGEVLAGMSDEQAAALDLSGDSETLHQRLQQVADEGEAVRREGEELRERMKALEKRMKNVAGQVIEYANEDPRAGIDTQTATGTPDTPMPETSIPASQTPAAQPTTSGQSEQAATVQPEPGHEEAAKAVDTGEKGKAGLSGTKLFLAIVLVVLLTYYLNKTALPPQRRGY